MLSYKETSIQEITDPILVQFGVKLFIKREDLNHPFVTGNKWWKLKYNLQAARLQGHHTLLTFGGAYSNHIYATAAAANECGFKSIGIIRGEENLPLNATLSFAKANGMHLHYISRELYRKKNEVEFLQDAEQKFGKFYLIPEGGTNQLAIDGVKDFTETLAEISFDYLCVPVGTGGTVAGLIEGSKGKGKIIGYSSLKGGEFLENDVKGMIDSSSSHYNNWRIETRYHQGGYGKVTNELLEFLKTFEAKHNVRLDPIYTGKMMWGIFESIKRNEFPGGSVILAIHTGGLQGWNGILDQVS